MRSLASILLLASILISSTADPVITPEPVTVAPADVHPNRPVPQISGLLRKLGVGDPNGRIRKFLKFFADPTLRNESASAYNGIRQAAVDAFSCFKQRLQVELQDQQPLLEKFVNAMHQVQVPELPAVTGVNASESVASILSPELNILTQLWSNPDFQEAYGQMRQKIMGSGQEGMRCLREKLATVRGDVEWILGHALNTFNTNTTTPAPSA